MNELERKLSRRRVLNGEDCTDSAVNSLSSIERSKTMQRAQQNPHGSGKLYLKSSMIGDDNNGEGIICDTSLPPWKSISFACGGWLHFYLYGVARAIQERGLDSPDVVYCGCSAGALAAAGLMLEGDFDAAVEFCKEECVPVAYGQISGLFKLAEFVGKCLDLYLTPKYKGLKDGTLQIAVTRLPSLNSPWPKGERATSYKSAEDLKSWLLASSAAFPFAQLVNKNGNWYIDGGLSDFQPVVDSDTLTVSPFYFSDCDVKPSRYVPLWWTFLPPKSKDTIDWLYCLGYEDMMAFIDAKSIPSSPRARQDIKAIPKSPHAYDTRRRISMHRFLGYNVGDLTHEYFSFIADLFLLLMLFVVWKPLALSLIYAELIIRMVVRFVQVVLTSPLSWRKYTECWEYFTCVWSLSLLLRFFTPACSSVELRKHDKLAKLSILYRVFRHII